MSTKELTGYPSIDKPWLKYYSEEAVKTKVTELSIYEYLLENNTDNMNRTALVYMGRKISYETLFMSIENVAKAFVKLGLEKGDVVACIAPSFPETIYSFYAANKLGAISDYFDPRTEAQVIYEELVQVKPKIFMIFEDFLPKFKEMIDRLGISQVIVLSAGDSLSFPLKLLASLKKKGIPNNYKRFSEIMKGTENEKSVETVGNIAHEVALMEHTGGTTGVPKAVCLTNQNVNAVHFQVKNGGYDTLGNPTYLAIAFPFTAYSVIGSQHDPLVDGMAVYLNFSVDSKEISKGLIRYKIGNMSNTPVVWERIIEMFKERKMDMSFLKNAIVGADSLSVEKEQEINNFLLAHNNTIQLKKGYGMTEVASAVSLTFSNECNKLGSVGIPFIHTIISVFDTETGEELKYGEQGEICISGPSVMKGYYNNDKATKAVLKLHEDGRLWMHSGDIGHMDEDGFLFIDGRIKRMLINHHGFKIFAPEIEKVLSQHIGVEKCCVVGAPDMEYKTGQIAVAFVIPKEGYEVKEEELQKLCAENLPEYYLVSRYVFTEEFPYTSAGKVDYRKLEEYEQRL